VCNDVNLTDFLEGEIDMTRFSSKLMLAAALSSLVTMPLQAQEKSGDGGPPKDQKPGDDKPKDGPPRDGNPDDLHPKETPRPSRGGTAAVPASGGGVLINNAPGVCLGNYMTNGTLSGNGGQGYTDNNIGSANGWSEIWTVGASSADLYGSAGHYSMSAPSAQTGNFMAFWAGNYGSIYHREGAKNLLNTSITKASGNYTLSFDAANLSGPSSQNPTEIGIYALHFEPPQTTPSQPTNFKIPLNEDLFGGGKVVKLGFASVPVSPIKKYKHFEIKFSANSFSSTQFAKMTHVFFAANFDANSAPAFLSYVAFDNFCLTKD
jgi:hypothetical protein